MTDMTDNTPDMAAFAQIAAALANDPERALNELIDWSFRAKHLLRPEFPAAHADGSCPNCGMAGSVQHIQLSSHWWDLAEVKHAAFHAAPGDAEELERLETAFDEAGGRGVDVADRIDELRERLDAGEHKGDDTLIFDGTFDWGDDSTDPRIACWNCKAEWRYPGSAGDEAWKVEFV